MKKLYFLFILFFISTLSWGQSTTVVISQIFAGGGNSGAPYQNDFIELYNKSASDIDLSTWSVQYESATAEGTWDVTNLTGTIKAGEYYLIREETSGTIGDLLPSPDDSGTINLAVTGGKIAVVSNQTAQTGICPSGVVDFVGYGNASCFEGSAALALTNTTSLKRKVDNSDTDNNSVDFEKVAVDPRNSVLSVTKNNIEGFNLYPNPITNGTFAIKSANRAAKNVQIFSLLGTQVYNKTVNQGETIQVSNLTKGIYLLRVEEEGKIATRKLIIN